MWIEIVMLFNGLLTFRVTPFAGVWIEIEKVLKLLPV